MRLPRGCARTLLLALGLCCGAQAAGGTDDPLERYNRAMFAFNETADRYLLKPVARGYRALAPDPVERGIARAFDNLWEVVNVANDLLQGKPRQALNDGGRFLVNSTLGILGFFDVASSLGLPKSEGEDFGQTLGRWGVGPGPYLVLPLLGASTLRDAPARVVDWFANPVNHVDELELRYALNALDAVATRAELLDAEQLVSGDRYTFIRDVYLQRRAWLVSDGRLEDAFGSDFDEEGYYDYQ
ncbi:MAG: lipoprotein [Porticoccaceae bacterium]|nr:MAG: lipoprotein [Porticoccaceae bacterium]